jgi:hypothetical protein
MFIDTVLYRSNVGNSRGSKAFALISFEINTVTFKNEYEIFNSECPDEKCLK